MRWIVLIAAATLCGAGLFLVLGQLRDVILPRHPQPASANSGEFGDQPRIFAAGIVEGLPAPLELRFETTGRINAVRVQEGELVRANQVLAELEAQACELRVAQAEAQWRIAVAEKDRLNGGRRTNADSSQSGRTGQEGAYRTISATSAAAKEDQTIADARVAAAAAAVKQEQLLLDKTRLTAPMDGTILSMTLKEGELAGPAVESASMTMVNRAKTRVRAFVEELDAMDVAVGQRTIVVASGPAERKYEGTILTCAPYVQPKSHRHLNPGERLDVRVREIIVELDDGAELLVGLPVEVFISGEIVASREGPPPRKVASGKKTRASSRQRANSTTVKP